MNARICMVCLAAAWVLPCVAGTLVKWFDFREKPLTVAVTSAVPCKVAVDGKLQGWTAGGSAPSYFRLVGGRGFRQATFTSEASPHGIGVTVLSGAQAAKVAVSDNVLGSAKLVCAEKRLWLHVLKAGRRLVFRADGTYRGFPSATIHCLEPGTLKVSWGGRTLTLVGEKPGGVAFSPVSLADADAIEFETLSGAFELSGVGFTTVADGATAATSFVSSEARLNADFAAAKRVCDRAKMDAAIRRGLGLKSIDEDAKTVTIDPTVRNGLVFCGVKIPVRDGILDIRWMRESADEMATVSQTLPSGWKLVRDFDMQAECQRLCDLAVAEGMQGGMQFCAYRNGRKIVDVFAGTVSSNANAAAVRGDTLFPIFSTEKPLLATACHRAVERGLMDYDKPLCTWWPELDERGFFAKLFDLDSDTKKERLTLRETLGYRTSMPGGAPGGKGNPVCDHMLSDRELCDWEFVCKVAAADRPNGVPGTVQAYLPYAYAWMIGHPLEVAMGKPLNEVLTEEVLIPSGIEKEFYFVVPRSEYPRVAEYYDGGFCENMNYDWARQALLPSAWGVSSAQALCKFYNRLCGFDGKEPLIKKETLDAALKPCRHPSDPLPNAKSMKRDWFMLFGMGYGLWGSAERMDRVFGHGGAGGSEALVDRDHKLIVGYTCNSCKNSIVLRDKLYEVVGMRWRYWNDNVNIQDLQMSTSGGGNYGAGITSQP